MFTRLSIGFVLAVAALALTGEARAKPERIVSLSVCSDQYVMALAAHEQIAAISRTSLNPEYSPLFRTAETLPTHGGRLEEILMLEPDLVISGAYVRASTNSFLNELGIPVVRMGVRNSLEIVSQNIELIAKAVGQEDRGVALLAEYLGRLKITARPASDASPLAAVYRPGGDSPGQGTVVESIMAHVGLRNLASELGVRYDSSLPVELLILNRPDYLIIDSRSPERPSLGQSILDHPGIAKTSSLTGKITVPLSLWLCAGPESIGAAELLISRLLESKETKPGESDADG
jgi:iron complex transport system substrate-binding protein